MDNGKEWETKEVTIHDPRTGEARTVKVLCRDCSEPAREVLILNEHEAEPREQTVTAYFEEVTEPDGTVTQVLRRIERDDS